MASMFVGKTHSLATPFSSAAFGAAHPSDSSGPSGPGGSRAPRARRRSASSRGCALGAPPSRAPGSFTTGACGGGGGGGHQGIRGIGRPVPNPPAAAGPSGRRRISARGVEIAIHGRARAYGRFLGRDACPTPSQDPFYGNSRGEGGAKTPSRSSQGSTDGNSCRFSWPPRPFLAESRLWKLAAGVFRMGTPPPAIHAPRIA